MEEYAVVIDGSLIYSVPGVFLKADDLFAVGKMLEGQRGIVVDKSKKLIELMFAFNINTKSNPRYNAVFRIDGTKIMTRDELVQNISDFELENLMRAIKDEDDESSASE